MMASLVTSAAASSAAVCASLLLTLVLLAGSYHAALGPWGPGHAFGHHPALMSVAFALLMPLGIVSYSFEAPCSTRLRKAISDRHARRRLHGVLGGLAAVFVVAGYYLAWSIREANGKSHLPWGKSLLKQLHIWGGYAAIALVVLQSSLGVWKYRSRVQHGVRVVPWHGRVGPAIWCAGCVSIATGAQFSFLAKGFTATGVATLMLLAALLPAVLLLVYRLPRPYLTDAMAAAAAHEAGARAPSSSSSRGGQCGGPHSESSSVSGSSGSDVETRVPAPRVGAEAPLPPHAPAGGKPVPTSPRRGKEEEEETERFNLLHTGGR